MTRMLWLLLAASFLVLPASAAEDTGATYRIGQAVADFSARDLDGAEWRLSDARSIDDERALTAVKKVAIEYGAKAESKADEALAGLSGLKGTEQTPAEGLRMEFARKVGLNFGLFPSAKTVEGWKTLGDAAAWIKSGATAPIVLVWWSPKCPTSARYEDRYLEMFAETGARFLPVATNHTDDDASIHAYLESKDLPYRVLVDRDAAIADRFGAKRTPHVFVLDETNTLRYSGAVDNLRDEGERADWLLAALKAIGEGQPVEVLMTDPKG
jgi:peroxiredoxin